MSERVKSSGRKRSIYHHYGSTAADLDPAKELVERALSVSFPLHSRNYWGGDIVYVTKPAMPDNVKDRLVSGGLTFRFRREVA